ncbi:MAG TPA: porin family protein [Chitinophagaceae bacterium]|nr:porin family protein [Chitinophagaceae bacterium]
MKTKLFGLAGALLISQLMMAQFHLGIKAGANLTKVDGKSFKQAFKYGYSVGGFAELGLGNKFSFEPEVLFNQYSSTLDSNYKSIYENVIASDQSKVKLNYLTIPLLLDYKFLGPIHLQAGPQFGVLMSQDKNFLQNGKNAFKNGDFSMVAGAQIKLAQLRITGRYIVGLSNINDIDNQDKWKNQVVQLSVGIAL